MMSVSNVSKHSKPQLTRKERNAKYRAKHVLQKTDKPENSENVETPSENVEKKKRRARIIIRNLSYKVTDDLLKEHFSKYGEIEEVNLLKQPDGKLVGCGFIQYKAVNSANKAIHYLSGKTFLSRPIFIDWAAPIDKYQPLIRKQNKLRIKNENIDNIEIKDEPTDDDAVSNVNGNGSVDNGQNDSDDDENDDEDNDDSDDDGDDYDDKKVKIKHEDDIDIEIKKEKFISNDVEECKTVFIKCVPMDATRQDLFNCCKQFGKIDYAVISVDQFGHSKGTGFVKFSDKTSADQCLQSGTEFKLFDQILDPHLAISRKEIKKKSDEKIENANKRDSRNLYLMKEGLIMSGNPASQGVSVSDMTMRLRLEKSKGQMLKNFNRFLSRERLVIHNIPTSYDDSMLKNCIHKYTKLKPIECRIMMKNTIGMPTNEKQFAFVSFKKHEEALTCLRKMNNNPNIFKEHSRPIVSFSIEDKKAHQIKEKRLKMSLEKNPTYQNKEEKQNALKKLRKDRRLEKRKSNRNKEIDNNDNSEAKTNENGESNNSNITEEIKDVKKMKNNNKKQKKQNQVKTNNNQEIITEDFIGLTSSPGKLPPRMRSNKKLRQQSLEHSQNIKTIKKQQRKQNEKKQIKKEKQIKNENIKKPIKNKNLISEKDDNFSLLVNKYKNLLTKVDTKSNPNKRTKWYND